MATKKTTTKEVAKKEEMKLPASIISPVLTEKASRQSDSNAFTFLVVSTATKLSIKKEIQDMYKVTPTHISILNQKGSSVFTRGKLGKKADRRKAIVFLKKGDTIALA